MGLIGNLGAYQQYQLGQAIPTAAANPAGGLAAAGVGLGMGMAYAERMTPTNGHLATVPPVPVQHSIQWYVAANGQPTGPFNITQLQEAVSAGQLTNSSLVWSASMSTWAPASTVEGLAGLFIIPPPIPPQEG